MERRYRLQKNGAFQYVYRKGHSVACRDLVLLFAKGKELKVGFSVSKKVGKAVIRNKVKRRLRECIRPSLGDLKTGLYVIVARPSAAEATFQSLQRDVQYLLKKQSTAQSKAAPQAAGIAQGKVHPQAAAGATQAMGDVQAKAEKGSRAR